MKTTFKLPKLSICILFAGAVVRIIGIGSAAIWHDEAVTLYRTAYWPLFSLANNNSEQSGDLLFELILRPLMQISTSVWMLRLPSLLASFVTLWLVWKLMQRLDFTPLQQVLTAAMIAFTPGLIWQAQSARAYSLLSMFLLAAIWFALEGRFMGMIACLGLMLYCHNTAPVYVAALLVICLMLYPWKARRIFLWYCVIGLAYIPQIGNIIIHQNWQGMAIQPLPPLDVNWFVMSLVQAFWASTHTTIVTLVLGGLAILLTFILGAYRCKARPHWVPALAFIIPFEIILVLSLLSNMFVYRILMPMIYTFYIWLGWELGRTGRSVIYLRALAALWLVFVLVGYGRYEPAYRGGYLDQTAAEIRSQWQDGDVLVLTTQTVIAFDYYLHDLPMEYRPVTDSFFLNPPGTKILISRPSPVPVKREWIVIPHDPMMSTAEFMDVMQDLAGLSPVYVVKYMQTSPLLVYLVER